MADNKTTSSMLDLLLNADESKLSKPFKEVEIKRLSDTFGVKFVVRCEAVLQDKMEAIQKNAIQIKGKDDFEVDMSDMQVFTVLEGVKDPNLKDKGLREKFGCPTPKELVRKLFLPGEIASLYNIISDLSGFGDKAVEEVKN